MTTHLQRLCLLTLLLPSLTACLTGEGDNNDTPECIEAIELCDPNDRRKARVVLYNECTQTATQQRTCPQGTVCSDANPDVPGTVIAATCVPEQDCGDPQAKRVCDPERPNDVYYADECGVLGRKAEDCMDSSSECIEQTPGEATCKCEVLPETYCELPFVPFEYYEPSYVTRRDTCGNTIRVEQCEYGSYCLKRDELNDGEATCERSIDPSQSNSPYYDYGCWNMTELVQFKTKLEADCRCRAPSGGDEGVRFVEVSTQKFPYGKLPQCQPISLLKGLSFDPPLGSGPQFYVFADVGQPSWFGGWFDPVERELYALVSLNSPKYRAAGTIVAFKVDTGARRVVSGVYPDPRMGDIEFGSGYKTPNTIPNGPAERALAATRVMRAGPDRQLYALSVGNTGQAESRTAEIIRVDPVSGERSLVWQSKTDERDATGYGQCISNNWPGESLTIMARSFAVDDQGRYYMSFYHMMEGMGIVRVSADGSSCEIITRHNAGTLNVGAGYESQAGGRYRAMLVKDGKVYTVVEPWGEFIRVDLQTGDRFAVSTTESIPGASPGESTIEYDPTRDLFYTVGGPGRYEGAVIQESTGKRQKWYGDIESVNLVDSVYPVRRDISSHTENPLHNGNYHGFGPFALDPDNPDIAWFVISGGGLLKMEWSTFNGLITSF